MAPFEYIIALLWLSLPVAFTYFWYRGKSKKLEIATIPHIRNFKILNNTDQESSFDGSTAKTLKRTTSYYPRNFEAENFVLTEYLRTPSGRFFIVKATPLKGVHYCQQMAQGTADALFNSKVSRGDA